MLKRAYTAADPVDAHMVCGMLQALGIHAVVKGDIAWSARGETPPMDDTAPQVWVDEADVPAARDAIERRERGDVGPETDWRCPSCGERLEGQFTQCWNCGADRPATAESGEPS
jgi:hypothetical protein